jgi:hypothetical protein
MGWGIGASPSSFLIQVGAAWETTREINSFGSFGLFFSFLMNL